MSKKILLGLLVAVITGVSFAFYQSVNGTTNAYHWVSMDFTTTGNSTLVNFTVAHKKTYDYYTRYHQIIIDATGNPSWGSCSTGAFKKCSYNGGYLYEWVSGRDTTQSFSELLGNGNHTIRTRVSSYGHYFWNATITANW